MPAETGAGAHTKRMCKPEEGRPGRAAAAGQTSEIESAPLDDHLAWLTSFAEEKGRPLRVLHVGNIANNAFLNAKFLRSIGIDAHVMSHDYRHVMAMPEWEEVEIIRGHGNDDIPRFSRRDLGGYRRPRWFTCGPLTLCMWDLHALNNQDDWRNKLRLVPLHLADRIDTATIRLLGRTTATILRLLLTDPVMLVKMTIRRISKVSTARVISRFMRSRLGAESRIHNLAPWLWPQPNEGQIADLIADFDAAFPDRPDRLSPGDIMPYQSMADRYQRIFAAYDVVQCCATDPAHALVSGKRPYVAFEHGTLRDFTMGNSPLHRMTALAYRLADHTFITNGDCLDYAKRLGIEHYSPIIHPIDVEQHRQDYGNTIAELRREIGGDVVLFSPIRHDWEIKGIDVHLRALPLIKARVRGKVKLVLIRWGSQLADSEALLESSGCSDDVIWRASMCRITMIKHIRAADVVLDQMALPHFGATAPQAIAAGTPVISSYDPKSTEWIIPEPAPILPAFSPEEVADAVERALDPVWRSDYVRRAEQWTDRYHHPNNVIEAHLSVYRRLLKHDRQGDRA